MVLDFINSFRDKDTIKALASEIKEKSEALKSPLKIMEVCGGHTHSIMKYGLKSLVGDKLQFIHGPGCPVCIMPKERIDHAYTMAMLDDVILVTLGDMIKVIGSRGSLSDARARGADVRFIYSPVEALNIARENPTKKVIYFAIGFETTTPMSAALLESIISSGTKNLYLHINHVLILPPLFALLGQEDCSINALLAPSHVSSIVGSDLYRPLTSFGLPIVVSGFEPVDVLESTLKIIDLKLNNAIGDDLLQTQYSRVVTPKGNLKAQELIDKYLEIRESFIWRGLGNIKNSSLKLKEKFKEFDAEYIYRDILPTTHIEDHKVCKCGEILKGNLSPIDCKAFGKACTPSTPLGSCMVSSEGACAAYYKYHQL